MASNFRHASDSASVVKVPSHDTSLDGACFLEEKRDCLAGLPPSSNVLSSSLVSFAFSGLFNPDCSLGCYSGLMDI